MTVIWSRQSVSCPGRKDACVSHTACLSSCAIWPPTWYSFKLADTKRRCNCLHNRGAVFFALQSAVLSVLLEWFYPIRNWKIESDLWHHPRKYVVPVIMLLAGAVSDCPVLLLVPPILLAVEIIVLLFLPCETAEWP